MFGTASTRETLETAAELGCDHTINYTEEDFVAVAEEETDDGLDLVLDGVGGETTGRSLDALREFGRMVSYGAASGEPGRPPTDKLLFGNKRVVGYPLGRAIGRQPERVFGAVPELTEMLAEGALVQVGHEFDLADAAEAHEFIEARKSSGKVVLVP